MSGCQTERGYVLLYALVALMVSSLLLVETGISSTMSAKQEINRRYVREFLTKAHLVSVQLVDTAAYVPLLQDGGARQWCAKGLEIQTLPCGICAQTGTSCLEIELGISRREVSGPLRDLRISSPSLQSIYTTAGVWRATLRMECRDLQSPTCDEWIWRLQSVP